MFAQQELERIAEKWKIERMMVNTDGRWRLFTKKVSGQRLVLAWLVMVGGLGLGPEKSLLLSVGYSSVGFVVA